MDRIQMQVVLVIQVLDAVTGQTIEESGGKPEISITSGKSPFYKGDGYYLFLQPLEPEAEVTIRAYGYGNVQGKVADLTVKEGICKIYMQPDDRYPLSTGIYGLQGVAEPGSTLLLSCREPAWQGRLTEDYEAGAEMIVFSTRRQENMEMEFRIQGQEQEELFKIAESMDTGQGQYRLAVPLSHSYQKGMTVLFPVKRIPVSASGEFVCYLPRKKGSRPVMSCELWKQNGTEWKKLELQAGTRLSIGRIE